MNIIVTGGAGFIGSNIAHILKKDHDVTIFDFKKPINNDCKFIQGDIKDPKNVIDSIKNCDVVIHLAVNFRRS